MNKTLFRNLLILTVTLGSILLFTNCGGDEENNPQNNGGNNGNNQNVGVSSNDFLASDAYNRLVVEIQYATGFEPPQGAINHLRNLLEERLNKPNGIEIITQEIAAPGKTTYTLAELRAIEDNNRTEFTSGNTIAAYFFFADGGYSEDTENSKVLGIAHKNTSMVLFQKTIEDNSGG